MPVINVAATGKTTPGLGFNTQLDPQGGISDTTMLLDALLHGSPLSATTTTPPANPPFGASYIVPAGATGAFTGMTGYLAVCNPTRIVQGKVDNYHWEWDLIAPKAGMSFFVQDAGCWYEFNGTSWIPGPLMVVATAPASASAAGIKGQSVVDAAGALYLCYATNSWKKFTGASF